MTNLPKSSSREVFLFLFLVFLFSLVASVYIHHALKADIFYNSRVEGLRESLKKE